jgi:hypothetical protein
MNDGAMAMLEPRQTLAALRTHGPRMALGLHEVWLPRLVPPEFV